MVNDTMYREIQSYKQQGYTIRRCARTIDVDRKTVRKYRNMTTEEYVKYLAETKKRTRILDPYWDEIASELEARSFHKHLKISRIADSLSRQRSKLDLMLRFFVCFAM